MDHPGPFVLLICGYPFPPQWSLILKPGALQMQASMFWCYPTCACKFVLVAMMWGFSALILEENLFDCPWPQPIVGRG